VLKLITVTQTQDAYGVWHDTEQSREIYCEVQSVTRSEFFEAGRSGLNPDMQFTVFFADYSGEEIVEYNGERYSVYRTYLTKDDNLELYVERAGGTNAPQTTSWTMVTT